MTITALVLFGVFGALGFGWRSWEQRRRTGSTGFRGISGRLGSAEWFAGVGFVAALVAAVAAPYFSFSAWSPLGLLGRAVDSGRRHRLAVMGIAATVYAQVDMGDSWRIGVDPVRPRRWCETACRLGTQPDLHRHADVRIRNRPGDTECRGDRRLHPAGHLDPASGARRRGAHLLSVHGDVYRDYLANVGRFVPAWGSANSVSSDAVQASGTSRSISSNQILADMSDGARQSPRGDSDPPCRYLGPFGSAERLNWLNE